MSLLADLVIGPPRHRPKLDVVADQIDIHLRPARLAALLDVAVTPLPSATDDEIQNLSISVRLRRSGRAVRMLIEGTDPFATAIT